MGYLLKKWEVLIETIMVWHSYAFRLECPCIEPVLMTSLGSGLSKFVEYFKEEIKDQLKEKPPNKF